MEYIKEIKLIDGTVLLNPTFEQIKENKLLEENGEGTKVYKGTIINYYANGSKN